MIHGLYEDFLDDARVYDECARFWVNLVEKVAASMGQAGKWCLWLPRPNGDGTPAERNGNPIFDGRSDELQRAVQILQHPALGDALEITAWVTTHEPHPAFPRQELVLSLSLSEESAALAEDLVRKWMVPDTTREDMEAFIDKRVPPMPYAKGDIIKRNEELHRHYPEVW